MSSVRVEDEARKDPRFVLLGKRLGTSRQDALGRMIDIWAYCTEKQTRFLSALVIDTLAEIENFAKYLIDPEISLAETGQDSGLIRIKGTKGRIEWLSKLRKNSRKGGLARQAKAKPKGSQSEAKTKPEVSPLSLAPVPVLAPSPVPVLTKINTEEKNSSCVASDLELFVETGVVATKPKKSKPAKDPEQSARVTAIIEVYCETFKARYQTYPIMQGPNAGTAKSLAKTSLGLDHILDLIREYLRMNDSWFLTNKHCLPVLINKLNQVEVSLKTGKALTQGEIRQIDRKQTNLNAFAGLIAEAEAKEQANG